MFSNWLAIHSWLFKAYGREQLVQVHGPINGKFSVIPTPNISSTSLKTAVPLQHILLSINGIFIFVSSPHLFSARKYWNLANRRSVFPQVALALKDGDYAGRVTATCLVSGLLFIPQHAEIPIQQLHSILDQFASKFGRFVGYNLNIGPASHILLALQAYIVWGSHPLLAPFFDF